MIRLKVPAGTSGKIRTPVTGVELEVKDGVVEVEASGDAMVMTKHLGYVEVDAAPPAAAKK